MKAFVQTVVGRFMVRQAHHEAVNVKERWYCGRGSHRGRRDLTHTGRTAQYAPVRFDERRLFCRLRRSRMRFSGWQPAVRTGSEKSLGR
jgi:hypothetical protein